MTEGTSSLIVLRPELHGGSEWFSPRSSEPDLLARGMQCFPHQWSQELELSGSYADAGTSTQWEPHQCKGWSSVGAAFTSAMGMTATEWECWKVRWQETEGWARMGPRLLIGRLSEACQDRPLLETPAQPILYLLLYVTSVVLLVMQWQSPTSFNI